MQAQLNREKQTIAELKQVYAQASKDVENKIRELSMRTDMENLQTIIYQKQYQEVLKKQIDNVLDSLHTQEFATIESFLTNCYTDGYIGVMYDIAGQGIPIIMPIDPKQVVQALQTDSKISTKLYTRLGEDVKKLKSSIRAELSRGITQGASYNQIAIKIAKGMKSDYNTAYNSAVRIARTEGHRIQCQSAYDAQKAAVSRGADVVKQWNSVLDGRTRPHHRQLDGQIRELNEPFEIGTLTADYPGAFGRASEDCNCRCALLQRARWALDDDELETLKKRAEYFDLDKSKDFEDYQKKYLKASEQVRDGGQKKNDEDTSQKKASDKPETLENTGKNGIIKLQAEINKMITPYEKKVLDNVPKKEGFFDFAAHGLPTGIEYGSKDSVLTAREVARIIKHHESYNGEKIRLLSCYTGSTKDGFAQQLANALGVEVEAPSDVLIVSPNGSYKIGYDGSGEMRTFNPNGRK